MVVLRDPLQSYCHCHFVTPNSEVTSMTCHRHPENTVSRRCIDPRSLLRVGYATQPLPCVWITRTIILNSISTAFDKSRSEQALGSEFHPREESEQVDFDFWNPLGVKKGKS